MTGHSPPFLLVAAQIHLASGCTHRVLMAPWLTRGRCGMALSDVLGRVEADAEKALETLKEYCRFPTISAHKKAQPETAAFVRRLLAENGFEAREYPTEGGPNVVFGQMIVDERKPTLMMYQHYDVQPVDPLNEWKHDPFDPTIQDGKFWGRGCGDTKGNLIMQLLAVQAWRAVEGRAPADSARIALPEVQRLFFAGTQRILGSQGIHRRGQRFRAPETSHLLPNVHDLRIRERLHRARNEDREPGGREGQDRFSPRPKHEAGKAAREVAGAPEGEGIRRHRAPTGC